MESILSLLTRTGPSKLPELGKELGKTVKSFQTAAKVTERVIVYGLC